MFLIKSAHLVLDQFLQRDLLLLRLLLLLILLEDKASGQSVAVHAGVSAGWTHPEPTVLIVLYSFQEVLTHLHTHTNTHFTDQLGLQNSKHVNDSDVLVHLLTTQVLNTNTNFKI